MHTSNEMPASTLEHSPIGLTDPLYVWMLKKGFYPAQRWGVAYDLKTLTMAGPEIDYLVQGSHFAGFLLNEPDKRLLPVGRYRRPFVACLQCSLEYTTWTVEVYGLEHVARFQALAYQLAVLYNVNDEVVLASKRPRKEQFEPRF